MHLKNWDSSGFFITFAFAAGIVPPAHKILKNNIMAKEEVKDGTGINAAKLKALQATIDKIEKDYGKGTIMKLGDQPKWEVSVIPSGSIALDAALGIGGYPR